MIRYPGRKNWERGSAAGWNQRNDSFLCCPQKGGIEKRGVTLKGERRSTEGGGKAKDLPGNISRPCNKGRGKDKNTRREGTSEMGGVGLGGRGFHEKSLKFKFWGRKKGPLGGGWGPHIAESRSNEPDHNSGGAKQRCGV